MKIILLFNKDKTIFSDLKNLGLKNCKLVFLNNIKFLKHYIEEFLPSYVIIPIEIGSLQDFLKFISNYSDIKIIITSSNKLKRLDNYASNFPTCRNLFLENVISAQDYKRILTVIDNSEKSSVSDCGLQPSINSVKENIKFINQQIISIYSLQGGVGKTTIAFNLAFYLKNMINVKILVVDLNFAEGQSDMPIAIGLTEAPNLGSYVEKITEDYDAFLDSILSLKGLNIDLIQPPVSIFQSDKFSVDMLDNLIYYARNEYNFIIADIPYRYDNICLEMLNLSTMLIFVMFPGPGAATRIRNLQKLLQGNQKKGIVINNVFGTNNFYLEEFIDDLGIPTLARIPFISEDEKDFIRIGKFRTDILNMQQEMVELVKKVI